MRRAITYPLLALALSGAMVGPILVSGCARQPDTVIERNQDENKETTGTLTPLQRGAIRRKALAGVREAIDEWKAGDAEAMKKHWAADEIAKFTSSWDKYASQGLTVKHVHEVSYLDVIDMNKTGDQVLVDYRYRDASYLMDKGGSKVRSLKPEDIDMQMTVNDKNGTWVIARTIAATAGYR